MFDIDAYHEDQRQQQYLIGYCQKVMSGIDNLGENSEQRAIWELVQNARDLSEHCKIKIRLFPDRIEFAHNGKPFTYKTLNALVMQNSSKDEEDADQVGQYGTGFMVTHTFNPVVTVDGTYEEEYEGEHIGFYPIDSFEINRDADTAADLLPIMRDALKRIDGLHKLQALSEKREWTVFTYKLSESDCASVNEQLKSIVKMIPYVLVINGRIKEFSILNYYSGECVCYRNMGATNPVTYEGGNGWQKVDTTIEVDRFDANLPKHGIHCSYLSSADGKDIIMIPPFDSFFGDINMMPSLFLWFPLLGTENFGLNFIFHSSRFIPVEKRNNILLPQKKAKQEKYQENERVLHEMMDALFAFYRIPKNAETLPIDACRVYFKTLGQEDDNIAKTFYDSLRSKCINDMSSWSFIPTSEGWKSLQGKKVKVLSPELYDKLDEEQRKTYEPIIREYASKIEGILLPSTNLIRWSEIINEWGGVREHCITLDEICSSIKNDSSSLHGFLDLIIKLEKESLFETHELIPNRSGKLSKKTPLRDGKTITDELFAIAKPILKTKAEVLVDPKYSDLFTLEEYKRTDLQDDISSCIRNLRSKTLGHKEYINYSYCDSPVTLENLTDNDEPTVIQLITYCSAFPTENPDSMRYKVMPYICNLYDVPFIQLMIPSIPGESVELYDSAFSFLAENTMLMLSLKDKEWLTDSSSGQKNRTNLRGFVSEYSKSKESDNKDRLRKYGIIPNQRNELCLPKNLRKNISVDRAFAELYKQVLEKDLYAEWVAEDFQDILDDFVIEQGDSLGVEMESELEDYLERKRKQEQDSQVDEKKEKALMEIIHHLENNEWTQFFKLIRKNLVDISYELGSKEQKNALYKIKMKTSQRTLDKLVEIVDSPDAYNILEEAQRRIEQQKERDRQFAFTFSIGKMIEDALRKDVSEELSCEPNDFVTDDEQNGQDMIIRYRGNVLYYLESKAKWNFNEQAHMSSQQMKQAVRNKDRYALLCVDCTPATGAKVSPDATQEEVMAAYDDIRNNTWVHTDIGRLLSPTIGSQVMHEDDLTIDSEKSIRVYSSLTCNISKTVFVSGTPLSVFIDDLKENLRAQIEHLNQ